MTTEFALLNIVAPIIENEVNFIYDHETEVIKIFTPGNPVVTDIIEVSFTSTKIKIVYLMLEGQSVCDDCTITDYLKWKSELEDK